MDKFNNLFMNQFIDKFSISKGTKPKNPPMAYKQDRDCPTPSSMGGFITD